MLFSFTTIISFIFGLIVISKTLTDFKQKKENWQMFLFWLVVWITVVIVALNPILISRFIDRFGNKSTTIGQIAGIGFIFLLYIIYRVYLKANRIEKQISLVVRKIALEKLKK